MTKLEEEIWNAMPPEISQMGNTRHFIVNAAAEVVKRHIDSYDEAIISHCIKFQEQFIYEDEHGDWHIKPEMNREVSVMEDLLNSMDDFQEKWLKENGITE